MSDHNKIYTKGGDKGKTSLLGGTRVPKYHDRIEAYGTLDELNSFIGLLRDQPMAIHYKNTLLEIQDKIFIAESLLAADKQENLDQLPSFSEKDILNLEEEIDSMNVGLPELKSFILPGGHPTISYCHISRTICRRAERLVIRLSKKYQIDVLIIKYLNRLSDYFFVLGRRFTHDLNVEEVLWKVRKQEITI
jgi:cob(I)alamin adenosyltransferase